MKPSTLSVCALLALSLPAFSQSASWDTDGGSDWDAFGNTLLFAEGNQDLVVTSWSHKPGKRNTSFQAAEGSIFSTGMGVTNAKEPSNVVEHQIDNSRGNDWVLILFEGPVSEVKLVVNPYGTWDRDVTYYTASISGPLDLTGKTYSDLGELGFNERIDDLSDRSQLSREVDIADVPGGFNAILIGAQQGKPGLGSVDRFKITAISAMVAVPEPSSALLGLLGGMFLLRRRNR